MAAIGDLTNAAGVDDEATLRIANRLQHHYVLELLYQEVLLDVLPYDGREKLVVQHDLEIARHVVGYLVRAERDTVTVEPLPWSQDLSRAAAADADVRIHQDLPAFAGMLRAVFGPAACADPAQVADILAAGDRGTGLPWGELFAQRSRHNADLAGLALRFGSDKWGARWYARQYQRFFAAYRDRPVRILEIGIGGFQEADRGGASLEMWKRYFPRALVFGIDIEDKRFLETQRLRTFRGNQADPEFLATVLEETGELDIVIDDGSHFCSDQIRSFEYLFPRLAEDGLYVIEDMETSYWPGFGGSSSDFSNPATGVGYLKQMVDGLNYEALVSDTTYRRRPTDRSVVGIHFFHSMAIIEKGVNEDGGLGAMIPDEVKRQGPRYLMPDYPVPPEFESAPDAAGVSTNPSKKPANSGSKTPTGPLPAAADKPGADATSGK
ncbi:methyltransferase domain-containing protein [Micromonospora rifamycinica]|uniref:Methyltransferase MycE N-terminal domain-containing protein n=1 Tax=Micromonospora rifamycinica TaxID=291594 RepID=A0A1C5HP50_9ACTN|nr:hypothetical protein [Micromonospora rifamycinica]SCG47772.1 hypothetical protein GA0070623_1506 [Micromonospora rifamycinica]